jgi:hypothetical protein
VFQPTQAEIVVAEAFGMDADALGEHSHVVSQALGDNVEVASRVLEVLARFSGLPLKLPPHLLRLPPHLLRLTPRLLRLTPRLLRLTPRLLRLTPYRPRVSPHVPLQHENDASTRANRRSTRLNRASIERLSWAIVIGSREGRIIASSPMR